MKLSETADGVFDKQIKSSTCECGKVKAGEDTLFRHRRHSIKVKNEKQFDDNPKSEHEYKAALHSLIEVMISHKPRQDKRSVNNAKDQNCCQKERQRRSYQHYVEIYIS